MSKTQNEDLAQDLENTKKTGFTKKRWLLLIDGAITLIILLSAVILIRHKPADYNAAAISTQEVSPYLTNRLLPEFYNGIQTGEPFELVIEQKGINEVVTSFGWPQLYNNVIMSTPAIAFSDSVVRIVSMINYNGVDMVFSVEINPQFDENGKLKLQLEKAKIGALSVTFVVKQVAQRMFNEEFSNTEPDNIVSLAIASLMRDEPFNPSFEFNGKKAKVDKIVIENEKLKVHFVPISRTADRK